MNKFIIYLISLLMVSNIYAANFTRAVLVDTNSWEQNVTNTVYTTVKWIDEKYSGLSFANGGGSVPARTEVETGSGIYGRGFDTTDDGDFSMQWQHGLAWTNKIPTFTNFWYNPHIHVSAAAITPPDTNCTFVLIYQIAPTHSNYNGTTITLQTTMGMDVPTRHYMLDFGIITNNVLAGKDSVVVRGNLSRIPSVANDISARVIVDSLDFHIPVEETGSLSYMGNAPY